MAKKKKDIKRPAKYRIRFDHLTGEKSQFGKDTKIDSMQLITSKLRRYPYMKASLEIQKKEGGYKAHSSYKMRYNRETKRHRLVKI